MWFVDPEYLCKNHLLGEHNEIHKLVGGVLHHPHGLAILNGQAGDGNVDITRARSSHDELVVEMERRVYNHDDESGWVVCGVTRFFNSSECSRNRNLEDLADRCEECRKRIISE